MKLFSIEPETVMEEISEPTVEPEPSPRPEPEPEPPVVEVSQNSGLFFFLLILNVIR